MKKVCIIALLAMHFGTTAQTMLFSETFDQPGGPDSVSTYNTNAALSSRWNDTTFLAVSAGHSYHTQVVPFDSVIFETQAFSTLGKRFVRLRFNHIAKVHFGQRCYIQVSVNNGTTWTNLSGTEYTGGSPQFGSVAYFNELSYPAPFSSPYWGGLSTTNPPVAPTNSWWANESFDLSNLAGTIQANGDTGYAQVKLRFIAAYQFPTLINPSGWYIDDVEVTGSACELTAPEISYNHPFASKPVGTVFGNANFNCKVTDRGAIVSGVSSATLHYRINGGAWQSNAMTPLTGASCPDSTQYSFQLITPVIGDTVDWYISTTDCGCGNSTRDPDTLASPNYYSYWRVGAPPYKCGVPINGILPYVISVLPYTEDFESAFWQSGSGSGDLFTGSGYRGVFPIGNPPSGQNWLVTPNATSVGYAWSVRSGSTATQQTGPLANHTPNGSQYLYTEASQGGPNNTTQLILPCLDLQNESCAVLEFYVHMYGSDISTLRLDVDTSSLSTYQWQNAYWSQIGELQSTSNAAWKRVVVPLNDFSGKIIRMRFVGIRGNGDKGDMAIDDIRILSYSVPDVDVMLPAQMTASRCSYSANEPITTRVIYTGCQANTKVPLAYELTNQSTGITNTVWDTLNTGNSNVIDTLFSFSTQADLGTPGVYTLRVYSALTTDTIQSNDTASATINHVAPYSTFPYLCTFDEAPWQVGNKTVNNPGTYDTSFFKIINPPGGNSWVIGQNNTPTSGTGPAADYTTRRGQYLFFATTGSSTTGSIFELRCLDFTALQNPHVSLWYHMYGADCLLAIQVKSPINNTWLNVPGGVLNGQQQVDAWDDWKFLDVDLSAYAGTIIQIRLVSSNPNQSDSVNTAIDNLMIYEKGATDAGVTRLIDPDFFVPLPGASAPIAQMRNTGNNTLSNVPVTLVVQPLCGGIPDTIVRVLNTTTSIGSTRDYLFSSVPNYPQGDFRVKAYTTAPNDANPYNDTLVRYITGREKIDVSSGYFQDFESCAEFTEGYSPRGIYRLFALDSIYQFPFDSAYSGTNAISLSDWNPYSSSDGDEIIMFPVFDGFDSVYDAQLSFWQHRNANFGMYAVLEYFDAASNSWEVLGWPSNFSTTATCDSVYNGMNNQGEPRWIGNTNGWEKTCVSLRRFNYSTGPVNLRLRAEAQSGNMDWAIDDIAIEFTRKGYDLAADELTISQVPTTLLDSLECQLTITNRGMYRVQSFELHYTLDGNTLAPAQTINVNMLPDQSYSASILIPAAAINPGQHQLCVWSANPNNSQDEEPTNDTVCISFEMQPMVSQLPYCLDFEAQQEFVSESAINSAQSETWQHGVPNKPGLNQAYSGTKCWITGTDEDYQNQAEDYLYTPPFEIMGNTCYRLSFYHNYFMQNLLDGGNVEFSLDSGKTWGILGRFGDSAWYNHPYVFSLGLGADGFSGTSNGWQYAQWKGGFTDNGVVIFRFRFASDYAIRDRGWAIDDFCFEQIPGNCTIGLDESFSTNELNLYPVPATTEVMLTREQADENLSIRILSPTGALLREYAWEKGNGQMALDVSSYANGIYWVYIQGNDGVITKRFIIQR
jgi:hypothetical protein